jgi:CYTH domain-containing protein
MGVEIERKYLVDHEKWRALKKPKGIHYKQGYILNDGKQTVRVRVSDKKAHLNLKSAMHGFSRKEFEYEIPLSDGLELFENFVKSSTEKIRYEIPFEGYVWEVDEFLGDNTGLIIAEIELESEEDNFEQPDWIGEDVTDDERYTNSSLSLNPYKNWPS